MTWQTQETPQKVTGSYPGVHSNEILSQGGRQSNAQSCLSLYLYTLQGTCTHMHRQNVMIRSEWTMYPLPRLSFLWVGTIQNPLLALLTSMINCQLQLPYCATEYWKVFSLCRYTPLLDERWLICPSFCWQIHRQLCAEPGTIEELEQYRRRSLCSNAVEGFSEEKWALDEF